MRVRYVGYDGARPAVPNKIPVVDVEAPVDPGPTLLPSPIIVVLADGVPFLKAAYLELGYNRFDVACIGGGGGRGGSLGVLNAPFTYPSWTRYQRNTPFTQAAIVNVGPALNGNLQTARYGSAGGGGGLHRIRGRLALLPVSVPVEVGQAGANPSTQIPGGDGTESIFGAICRASGGKGGRSYSTGYSGSGEGGIGNAIGVGGGAAPGVVGTWDGAVGKGGGGGLAPISGGAGSYSVEEPTTSGPGDAVGSIALTSDTLVVGQTVVEQGTANEAGTGTWVTYHSLTQTTTQVPSIAGFGGGAKPFQVNGDALSYGSRAEGRPGTGLVVVKLTYSLT